jgi:hypothetical protein
MGAYATASDVQLRVGALYTLSASSTPSTDDVLTLVADAEAELNAALMSAGHATIPATGDHAIAFLRGKVAMYVAAQVIQIAFGPDAMPALYQVALEEWAGFVMRVGKGEVGLPGADNGPTSNTLYRVRLWNRPD